MKFDSWNVEMISYAINMNYYSDELLLTNVTKTKKKKRKNRCLMTTILLCSQSYAKLNRMYAYAYIAFFYTRPFWIITHTLCFSASPFFLWYKRFILYPFLFSSFSFFLLHSSTPMLVNHYRTRNIIVSICYAHVYISYKDKWTINIKIKIDRW